MCCFLGQPNGAWVIDPNTGVITGKATGDWMWPDWMVATDALEDPATRRAVDRLVGAGCHFAL